MFETGMPLTNREQLVRQISRKNLFAGHQISELSIQGQKMTFSSSGSKRMETGNFEGYMLLQHFFEKGLTFEMWDDKSLSDIMLTLYEQDINEEFPCVDATKEIDITLRLRRYAEQVPVYMPLRLEFGEMKKGNRFSFHDPEAGRERVFYINKLEHFDYWEKMDLSHLEEFSKTMPEKQFAEFKKHYLESMEQVCPRGMDLAVLEYETEDEIQLNFYSSKYLDETPVRRPSAVGVIFGAEQKTGINGHRPRLCPIMPVAKDFYGSMDVELFSWYREYPEETIQLALHPHA